MNKGFWAFIFDSVWFCEGLFGPLSHNFGHTFAKGTSPQGGGVHGSWYLGCLRGEGTPSDGTPNAQGHVRERALPRNILLYFSDFFWSTSAIGTASPNVWFPSGEAYDAHSSLFDFSQLKNFWAKVTLGRVKNTRIPKPNLHPGKLEPFRLLWQSHIAWI